MGYKLSKDAMNAVLTDLRKRYDVYAPKCFEGGNTFSEVDCIRYGKISAVDEIVTDKISDYSFKELLLPFSETLFFFTEDTIKEAAVVEKDMIIFLRSCDLHAVRRLDQIYLHNGPPDYYYQRLRENVQFVLMGCQTAFDSCFCVDMGTNKSDTYDAAFEVRGETVYMDSPRADWDNLLKKHGEFVEDFTPSYVTETPTRVSIPSDLSLAVAKAHIWDEYDSRCIACGRCNFVCPTCTCFNMQDIYYTDNSKVGERRRVASSCMVDGFTEVAGGGDYRKKNGERMRFKTLHKVYDFNKRNGYQMCVGCGRCDDCCPEYISFSRILNRLEDGMQEVRNGSQE